MGNVSDLETTAADMAIGTISCFCFSFGTVGNSITLAYFINKVTKTKSDTLFMIIAFIDIVISLLIISVGVSHFNRGKPMLFANKIYCTIWSMS